MREFKNAHHAKNTLMKHIKEKLGKATKIAVEIENEKLIFYLKEMKEDLEQYKHNVNLIIKDLENKPKSF